ncbi:hypothetical protein LTR78_006029 [Recurvomyces mirabilis]|uniref:GID complex catalytic subunit 2 n=1 Tax=Recurvomyces mirabilis TaxID=574656 RepID=A0AAE1C0Q5_9PEZI|nr:hypothetical protein LTR78_006029 [Recurvomyces mirabilis]KAK5155160.1 hypothetical protein LTS14_006115 [Recurvomyces mirabilis]
MESILAAHETLSSKANLSKALQDVDALISLLQNARDNIESDPDTTPLHIAKLKTPLKQSFDKIDDDLKEVNKGLNQYQKALKDKFKASALPTASIGSNASDGAATGLDSQRSLVERAIAMHLLREGKFDVASTFVKEVSAQAAGQDDPPRWLEDFADQEGGEDENMDEDEDGELDEELYGELGRGHLQRKFAEMYHILDALRNQHNLTLAIEWARNHSAELEDRGSNLEYELSRLKFVELYTSSPDDANTALLNALDYARATFPTFNSRYARETAALVTTLAYSTQLADSPYSPLFNNPSLWTSTSQLFTREFTSLLNLPSTSPLRTAITAGGLALPILQKVERIMSTSRGQWTSVNELPVETPLPANFMFHSIFVCPVSKEQGTDLNPPMMLPCGHVIAKESLEGTSRGKSRVKCPYCPIESKPGEARRVYI